MACRLATDSWKVHLDDPAGLGQWRGETSRCSHDGGSETNLSFEAALERNLCWIHFQHYGSGSRCGTREWMCDEYECYGCVVDLYGICMAGTVLSRWCFGRMMEDIGIFCKILENRSIGIWIEINADFPVNNGMVSGYLFSSIHHLSKEWPMERRGGYQGYQRTSYCSPCPVGMQNFHWSFPTRRWSSSKIVYIRSAIGACAFTCCASTSDCWTKRCRSKWSCWWLDFNEKFPSWLQMLCAPVAPHAF